MLRFRLRLRLVTSRGPPFLLVSYRPLARLIALPCFCSCQAHDPRPTARGQGFCSSVCDSPGLTGIQYAAPLRPTGPPAANQRGRRECFSFCAAAGRLVRRGARSFSSSIKEALREITAPQTFARAERVLAARFVLRPRRTRSRTAPRLGGGQRRAALARRRAGR